MSYSFSLSAAFLPVMGLFFVFVFSLEHSLAGIPLLIPGKWLGQGLFKQEEASFPSISLV